MKFAVIADVHVGNHRRFARPSCMPGINSRCVDILDVLEQAVCRAEARNANLIVAGDLLDRPDTDPRILAEIRRCFRYVDQKLDLLVGNHDSWSSRHGDHGLGVFEPFFNHRRARGLGRYCVMDFRGDTSGRDTLSLSWSSPEDELRPHPPRLLFAHMGVIHTDTPPWLCESTTAVHEDDAVEVMDKLYPYAEILFCGDWHRHYVGHGGRVRQVGALVPTGFDNPSTVAELDPAQDPYGTVYIVDVPDDPAGAVKAERLVLPGPRFVPIKTTRRGWRGVWKEAAAKAHEHKHVLFLQITVPAGDVHATVAEIDRAVHREEVPCVEGYEVRGAAEDESTEWAATIKEAQADGAVVEDVVTAWVDEHVEDTARAPVLDAIAKALKL